MMGFIQSLAAQFCPTPGRNDAETVQAHEMDGHTPARNDDHQIAIDADVEQKRASLGCGRDIEAGVANVEAIQAIWGKKGRYLIIVGLAAMMIMYEIDNSTIYVYQNYATSYFSEISLLGTLGTAGVIVFAVVKPPIAKLSNVIGRGQTYMFTIWCYLMSYILCASAASFNTYAAGYIFYCVGQSGTNILNDILISDITSARWRGLAIGMSFFPFLITPWAAAYITQSVINGIGWRWGIGMMALPMPLAASFIIATLLYYQGKAKKARITVRHKLTVYEFCSQIDLGGSILFCGGLAMLLLPLTLAAGSASKWRTSYIDALIALGGTLLLLLPIYEKYWAKYPLIPIQYFKNLALCTSILLYMSDTLGFACTHTYLYAWSQTARGFSIRISTFYIYTNGVMQCLAGTVAGLIMLKTRRYKWLAMSGVCTRLLGYGLMIRLRGSSNSIGELFAVQVVQGLGSGIITTSVFVGAQIQVPHAHLAQVTALIVCFAFLGSSIGACISGGIYRGTFKGQLVKELGIAAANSTWVDELYDSITGVVPPWGTMDRIAIDEAYTNVMRFMTYAAVGASIPSFILACFLPDKELPDQNNMVER